MTAHEVAGRLDRCPTMPGVMPVLTETPGAVCSPGPVLGVHTETVLQGIARLTPEEVTARRRERVIERSATMRSGPVQPEGGEPCTNASGGGAAASSAA